MFSRHGFFFVFSLSLCSLWPGVVQAQARRPATLPVSTLQSHQFVWTRDEHNIIVDGALIEDQLYVDVDILAKVTQAPLQWAAVSQQVCMSRSLKTLCFNWGKNAAIQGSSAVISTPQLHYQHDTLYVPLNYVVSPHFSSFADAKMTWKADQKRLIQEAPVTFRLPSVENEGDRYRLVFPAEDENSFALLEKSPKKIWLQFLKARSEGTQTVEGDGVIKEIRVVQHREVVDVILLLGAKALTTDVGFDDDTNKVVLDVYYSEERLQEAKQPHLKPVHPTKMPKSKLTKKGGVALPAAAVLPPLPILPVVVKPSKPKVLPKPVEDKRIRTIVVDAGHGGYDCGAIGAKGTFEKDVNLRVAKVLAERLKKEKNIRVIMTRDTDEFVALKDRTKIANAAKADFFVSIHCNSSLSSDPMGFEVYVLATSATDEAAASVARVENSVVALESKKGGDDSSKLNEMLASMAVYNYINESYKCANFVLKSVKETALVQKTSVLEANFHVLRTAQMPGVLIELDYLSNPKTEAKLLSSRYTNDLVDAIREGIMNFDKGARMNFEVSKEPAWRSPVKKEKNKGKHD